MVLKISHESTPVELFEDYHKRMGLRNRISNAMMAIALYEVESKSPNLPGYIEDGIEICQDFLNALQFIEETQPNYYPRDYPTKILIDILTNQLRSGFDVVMLKTLEQELKSAHRVFEIITQRGKPGKEKIEKSTRLLERLDGAIESTYAIEDALHRRPHL